MNLVKNLKDMQTPLFISIQDVIPGHTFLGGIDINHYMFTGSHRVHLYQIFEEVTEPSDGRWLHFSFVINIETLLHNRATCSSQSSGSSQVLVAMFAGFSVS